MYYIHHDHLLQYYCAHVSSQRVMNNDININNNTVERTTSTREERYYYNIILLYTYPLATRARTCRNYSVWSFYAVVIIIIIIFAICFNIMYKSSNRLIVLYGYCVRFLFLHGALFMRTVSRVCFSLKIYYMRTNNTPRTGERVRESAIYVSPRQRRRMSAFSHTSHTRVTYEWCPLRHLSACKV